MSNLLNAVDFSTVFGKDGRPAGSATAEENQSDTRTNPAKPAHEDSMAYDASVKPAKPSARYRRHLAKRPPTVRGCDVVPAVYFVRAETLGLVKIGWTVDLEDRLKTLQVGSPDKLTLVGAFRTINAEAAERELHARFAEHRSHGEWFRPCPALLRLMEASSVEEMRRKDRANLRAGLEAAYSTQHPQEVG